jgi:hypothetical protein
MLQGKPGSLEWISSEWETSLQTLTTILQRLELFSSLRDLHTGRYVHHGMSLKAGTKTHAILLKSHLETFAEWQSMNMRQQMRDLKAFLDSVASQPDECDERITKKDKRRLILQTWTDLETYRNFVPQPVSRLEKDLFLVNFTTMVAVLKRDFSEREARIPNSATGT